MQAFKIVMAVLLSIILFVALGVMGLMVTLNQTVLNADFMTRQIDRLDISQAVGEILSEDTVTALLANQGLPVDPSFLAPVVLETLDDSEPWIKEQASLIVHGAYDYVQGRSDSLSFDISFVGIRDSLEANLTEFLSGDTPPELLQLLPQLAQLPPEQQQAMLLQFIPTLMSQIPESVSVDLAEYSPEAVAQLDVVRGYWGYVNTAFWGSVGLVVLLILLIVLVFRSVRGSCITLGVVFSLYGALMLVIRFAADATLLPVLSPYLMISELPAQLTTWVTGLVYAILSPALWLGVGFTAIGVVLIVAGAVLRRGDRD